MAENYLLHNVRPMGGVPVDLLIVDGYIAQIAPTIAAEATTTRIDGQHQLLLPGLVNAHAHIDKNLFGHPWHKNQTPEPRRIVDYVDNERRVRRELDLSARTQSICVARGAPSGHPRAL